MKLKIRIATIEIGIRRDAPCAVYFSIIEKRKIINNSFRTSQIKEAAKFGKTSQRGEGGDRFLLGIQQQQKGGNIGYISSIF